MKRKLITELSFPVKLTFRALRHGYTYSGNTTITWREQGDIFTPVWHEFQTTTGSTGVFPLIDIDNLVQTRWIKNITLYCTFCTHLTYDNNRLAEYKKKKKRFRARVAMDNHIKERSAVSLFVISVILLVF